MHLGFNFKMLFISRTFQNIQKKERTIQNNYVKSIFEQIYLKKNQLQKDSRDYRYFFDLLRTTEKLVKIISQNRAITLFLKIFLQGYIICIVMCFMHFLNSMLCHYFQNYENVAIPQTEESSDKYIQTRGLITTSVLQLSPESVFNFSQQLFFHLYCKMSAWIFIYLVSLK